MTVNQETCASCKFFESADSTCRINPPVRLPRKFDAAATSGNRVREEALIWGWPAVTDVDWCGQWKAERPS